MKRMTLRLLTVFAALGLVFGLTSCSKKQTKSDEEPTAEKSAEKKEDAQKKKKSVILYQYRFQPNTLTVKKGTTVEFMNKDQEKHNVKIAALDVDKNLEPGKKFSHTFKTTGEFAVENRLSEKSMKMTIVVEE